ncbi:conjugal transfer protein [Shimazuella sp. AN120528]|uniref:conjugal transfer protein n=1 Tax=Shimazuella soli TaxID=1892854 RepID=UPI001F0F96CF|nr:conjugal transfer protein [Shimazuella soli]MCH5585090.1 conjugal transfer protein [Shimazuella soli]
MNPTRNARLKQVARIVIYAVLVVFLIRNLVDVYFQIAGRDEPAVQQTSTSNEVPDTAKSVAKLFLENWYSIKPDGADDDRIKKLTPFITPNLYSYISTNADLRINTDQNQTSGTATQNSTTQNSTASNNSTTTNTSSTGDQQQPFQGVSAKEVDIWQATWKDQKNNIAQVVARLQTNDDKALFLALPVVKSGSTWQVSALPALIAEPEGVTSTDDQDQPQIDIPQKDAMQTVLEDFFSDWLKGHTEASALYMANGKPIPTTNWEENLNAQFVGVQQILPDSNDNPLKVSVYISMRDSNNVEFQLNYHVTFQEKNGKLFIVSIN